MLISNKYKFIYIKPMKVAGTSTESFLERYCLSDNEESGHTNNIGSNLIESSYGIIGARVGNKKNKPKWFGHKLPLDIKNDIGEDIWNSYKKICNVRNPFDFVVSRYYMKKNLNKGEFNVKDFESFLTENLDMLLTYKSFIKPNGLFSYDYYIKYENLEDDIKKVMRELNLPDYGYEIPKYRIRPNRPPYRYLYTKTAKKIIYDNFSDVLNHFNYEF